MVDEIIDESNTVLENIGPVLLREGFILQHVQAIFGLIIGGGFLNEQTYFYHVVYSVIYLDSYAYLLYIGT